MNSGTKENVKSTLTGSLVLNKVNLIVDSGIFFDPIEQVYLFGTAQWVLRSLMNLCNHFNTYNCMICWDSKHSLRKEVYPEYKGNRKKRESKLTDDEWNLFNLEKQILRKEILPKCRFVNQVMKAGYEADDLIAKAIQPRCQNIIVSNDSDLYQLLSDKVTIYLPRKHELFNYNDFFIKFGFEPYQYVNFKAMVGDSSDNLKGIPNVGVKRATAVIRNGEFLDVQKVYFDVVGRNDDLMQLPFKGCPDFDWELNQPSYDNFNRIVDEYNLEFFKDPLGITCSNRFFSMVTENKAKKSIRIRGRYV